MLSPHLRYSLFYCRRAFLPFSLSLTLLLPFRFPCPLLSVLLLFLFLSVLSSSLPLFIRFILASSHPIIPLISVLRLASSSFFITIPSSIPRVTSFRPPTTDALDSPITPLTTRHIFLRAQSGLTGCHISCFRAHYRTDRTLSS